MLEKVAPQFEGREKEIGAAFRSLNKKLVRRRILTDQVRIDGRGITDIRPLSAEVEVVPRAHGSALFERGETQIMGVTTLNMLRMEQQIDSLGPETHKRYLHHYNFPPYSTGETGRVGSPKRREIGHGALAERALLPVLPTREEFPYAIRQVSEALGSNGSTSMGSVCASTMSLLNAGVPLKAPVAGIAMGLVSDEVDGSTRYVALTDILGAEDAFGDMDFKVAGTAEFVTALQLDTKLDGIPSEVLAAALNQAKDARLTILEVLGEAIDRPDEMSRWAPRVVAIKVPVDKIGEVIGPKGKMINSITEQTGADISIEDDGTIYVGASDGESAEAAIGMINAIANPQLPKVGERFLGTVVKTAAFGAFVSLVPGKDGLVHISKLGNGKRIGKVEDVVKVGDKLRVEVTDIDNRGKISLIPVVEEDGRGSAPRPGAEGRAGRGLGELTPVTDVVTAGAGPRRLRSGRLRGVALRTAGRAARRHRGGGGRAVGLARDLDRHRLPRRDPGAGGRRALPGTPAVQGHAAAHRAGRSPRSSTPSAATSTRSPRRSTPATTRTSWTPTCRSRWRCSPTSSPTPRCTRPTSRSSAASCSKRSRCATTTRRTCSASWPTRRCSATTRSGAR